MPKVATIGGLMVSQIQVGKLNELVERLFDQKPNSFASKYDPPFDTSRPNIHDSKKAFLREQRVVENIIGHLSGVLKELQRPEQEVIEEWGKMSFDLSVAIEVNALNLKRNVRPKAATDLALQILTQTGFYHGSLSVVSEMLQHFSARGEELKRQEAEFWMVRNRPPNYYARTISLRFAKLYATQRSAKPTFGTARDGGHPSTEFGSALEEVFNILEIKANLKRAAEWAINELRDEDWKPKNALGGLLGLVASKMLDDQNKQSVRHRKSPSN